VTEKAVKNMCEVLICRRLTVGKFFSFLNTRGDSRGVGGQRKDSKVGKRPLPVHICGGILGLIFIVLKLLS
jgi:hypothetical protein